MKRSRKTTDRHREDRMEAIRDIDQHMLCNADPNRGIIEHASRKDRILIYLPVGGEVTFVREKSCTVVRREGHSVLRVYRYHQDAAG